MIRSPSHLQRSSHGIYYFRVVVPDALKSHLKRREIKCSLRTRCKQEAIGRALPLSLSIRHVFGNLSGTDVTYKEAKILLDRYLQQQMAMLDASLEKNGPLQFDRVWNLEQSLKRQRSLAALEIPTEPGRKAAQRILKAEGIKLDPASKEFQEFSVWATKMVVAQIESFLARNGALGAFSSGVEPHPQGNARSASGEREAAPRGSAGVRQASAPDIASVEADSPTISQALAVYTAEKLREGSWTEKTKETARSKHDLLVRIVGDIPMREVGPERVRDYKQILQKLPSNINTKPLYRSKTIEQILALKPEAGMSVLTVNNYLAWASTFFDWAERNGYLDRNPFRKTFLKNPKRASEARAAYTRDDLQKIFSTPQYRDHSFRHPHYYWLPLLGLHSGARLNELCQLHLKDIRQEDGVWVLDINETDAGKRIKTRSARRLVPVHPKLIELGLLRYVEQMKEKGHTRLFPELKQMRDGSGQAASKWFARYRKPLGLYKNTPKKDFHSFRTTLINELKQKGHPEAQVAAIVGHATEGLTYSTYGKAYVPSVLTSVLADFDFATALVSVRPWKS